MNRPTILIIGDAGVATGFARVLRSIFEHLYTRYNLHHLATGYTGDPHGYHWHLYPAHTGGDQFGVNRIQALMNALRPQIVFALHDIWIQADYMQALLPYRSQTQIVLYVPLDAEPLDPDLAARLNGTHRLYTFSTFSQRVISDAIQRATAESNALSLPPVEVIPLGVDTHLFHPIALLPDGRTNRVPARRMVFGEPALDDLFIVLNANRNQTRKRIDITIKGFAQFAADKPENVRLYLHMGTRDLGWDITKLARMYGIEDRLILTSENSELPMIPADQLNLIFNACDVGINTAVGESWGLISFEHGATGAAQIVPNHSAPAELWRDHAALLEPAMSLTHPNILTEEQFISPETAANTLERIYNDTAYRRELASKAKTNATQPTYQWDTIANQWDEIFQTLIASKP